MILQTRGGTNREVRLFEAAGFIPRAGSADIYSSTSGRREIGIAAVAACVRVISEEIGGFVMRVYQGDGQMQRQPVYDATQAKLFQRPAEGWTSFELWSDVAAMLELEEHAFIWKSKDKQGRVLEMWPIDPSYVRVTRDGATKKVMARVAGKTGLQDITANVVHIRAWSPSASPDGVSTIDMHQSGLKIAHSYDMYRGRYLDNDGTPGIVLSVPGQPDAQKRKDYLDGWWKRHGGVNNVGRPGIAWGGMTVQQLSPNLRDSQAAEIADVIVRDIGRMFRFYPLELLHGHVTGAPRSPEAMSDILVRFTLLPRMRRIERALAADQDIFPDGTMYPRFDVSELLRADLATSATIAHNLVQVGAATKDEGRAMVGLPPLPNGQGAHILETPVGGAPNEPVQFPVPTVQDPEQVSRRETIVIPIFQARDESVGENVAEALTLFGDQVTRSLDAALERDPVIENHTHEITVQPELRAELSLPRRAVRAERDGDGNVTRYVEEKI